MSLTDDIVSSRPNVNVDGVQDGEQGETPRNSVDNDPFAMWEELVYNSAKEE